MMTANVFRAASLSVWLLFSALCGSAEAGSVNQAPCISSLGYQQITNLSSAVGFTTVPSGTSYVVMTTEVAGIRWRDDGTAPTASVGMPVAAGASVSYTTSFTKFQAIQQTSGAILDVYFCR